MDSFLPRENAHKPTRGLKGSQALTSSDWLPLEPIDAGLSKNLAYKLLYFHFSNSTSGYIRQRTDRRDAKRYLYTGVNCSIIHNSQKVMPSQCLSMDACINKLWSIHTTKYCVCVCSVPQWCLTLCNPINCSLPGSSVHGIILERILEWAAMLSSRRYPWPKSQTCISWGSCIGRHILLSLIY